MSVSQPNYTCTPFATTTTVLTDRDYPAGRVLVVVHPDRWIEVFGGRSLDVAIVQMPTTTCAVNGLLAENLIELSMPERFRQIYWPNNLRAMQFVEEITAAKLLKRSADMTLLAAYEKLERANKATPPTNDDGGRIVWMG